MRVSDFMWEMRQTSAVLSRNNGVQVVFEGEQAATDGNTIYLPALPLDKELSHEQVMAMRGFVDHEAGHIKHSDMPLILDFYDRCMNNGKERLKQLHNAIEDVWMEDKVVDDYPGALKNLNQTHKMMRTKELKHYEEVNAWDVLDETNAFTVGCGIVLKNPLHFTPTSKSKELFDHLNDKTKEWSEKFVEETLKCKNTQDTVDLAKSIYKLLEDDPNLSKTNPEDFDPKSGEDMDVGDNSEEFKKGEGKGKGQKGKGEGEGKGNMPGEAEGKGELIQDFADVLNASDDYQEGHDGGGAIGHMVGHKGDYRVFSTSEDVEYRRGVIPPKRASQTAQGIVDNTDPTKYYQVKDKTSGVINVIKNKLRRALLAKQQRDWDPGREVGRLDTKRLVSAYNGSRNVYKQRIDRTEADTAITILVDLSGSMSGEKAKVTRDSAVALAECLEGSNMPFKIVGFCNKSRHSKFSYSSENYTRVERLDTVIFKDYNDSLRSSRGAISRIDEAVGGNNTDYDFLMNEIAYLKKRPEKRKVLFVLSDGHPAHGGRSDTYHEMELMKTTIIKARREDIECVGIGICDSSVSRIYPDHVVIRDVNDLSSTIFNKLSKILVG